jgi:hypothetical protein
MEKINNKWFDNIPWIIEKYKEGFNQVVLAAEFDTATNTTIRRILIKHNIPIRPNGVDQRKVKHNPFIEEGPDRDYWLGVFCADGCVYKHRIELGSARPEHLKQYIEFLSCDNIKLLKYTHGIYKSDCYSVKFSNKGVFDYMCSLGITPKKSHTLEYKGSITWDFIRGVIDGDGCVIGHRNKAKEINRITVNIATASVKFKDQIFLFFQKNGLEPVVHSRNNVYTIHVNKQEKVKELYFNLYNHAPRYFIADKYHRFGAVFGEIH